MGFKVSGGTQPEREKNLAPTHKETRQLYTPKHCKGRRPKGRGRNIRVWLKALKVEAYDPDLGDKVPGLGLHDSGLGVLDIKV